MTMWYPRTVFGRLYMIGFPVSTIARNVSKNQSQNAGFRIQGRTVRFPMVVSPWVKPRSGLSNHETFYYPVFGIASCAGIKP